MKNFSIKLRSTNLRNIHSSSFHHSTPSMTFISRNIHLFLYLYAPCRPYAPFHRRTLPATVLCLFRAPCSVRSALWIFNFMRHHFAGHKAHPFLHTFVHPHLYRRAAEQFRTIPTWPPAIHCESGSRSSTRTTNKAWNIVRINLIKFPPAQSSPAPVSYHNTDDYDKILHWPCDCYSIEVYAKHESSYQFGRSTISTSFPPFSRASPSCMSFLQAFDVRARHLGLSFRTALLTNWRKVKNFVSLKFANTKLFSKQFLVICDDVPCRTVFKRLVEICDRRLPCGIGNIQ